MSGGAGASDRGGGTSDRRAVCAGCGCLCDDVRLEGPPYERGEPNVETDCRRGRRWFARRVFGPALADRRPAIRGEPASMEDAAARAAELLAGALHPRVAGLERLPLGAQRRLVEVADRTGADVDAGEGPGTMLAVHRDGGHFLTLGEIRQRVDCLVLWFVEPHRTHPRLLERFYPSGHDGDEAGDRTLVAVGPRAEETPADVAVEVAPDRSLRLLWLLRLLADDPDAPERETDPLGGTAAALLERLTSAERGAWIYGGRDGAGDGDAGPAEPGPGGAGDEPVETAGVLRLLHRLNDHAPWGARPLRGQGNPAGAEAVLTWQSGYPAAVSYRSGRPRYAGPSPGPGPTEGGDGPDVVLVAGGAPAASDAGEGGARVWLDTGGAAGGGTDGAGPDAEVRIPVLPPGARPGETLLRMDGVSVRSPGIPGSGEWDGTPAEAALEAVLRELARIRQEGATG